ncbi:Neurexin-3-alpha [Eufriesea mexicana]|uniref:Neurexin-3-alpha n=1 Tax=Eufriesea mexicana TaxID=516756 RepID=A0A310SFT1_9HYME|nr:Neurexin-3-alpha [Eufriesea mexicana]
MATSEYLYEEHPMVLSVADRRMICGGNEHFNRRVGAFKPEATRFGATPGPLKPCPTVVKLCDDVTIERETREGKGKGSTFHPGPVSGLISYTAQQAHALNVAKSKSRFTALGVNKAPSEASFRGTEYLTIDLSKGSPILSTQESISLQFKTRQPNGLLFYSGKRRNCASCPTGEGDDYLTVSLRDGGAAVGMTLAKGRLDLHVKPVRVRFDDNQWHKIIVHRKVQEVHPSGDQVITSVYEWRDAGNKDINIPPLNLGRSVLGSQHLAFDLWDYIPLIPFSHLAGVLKNFKGSSLRCTHNSSSKLRV